MFRNNQKSPCRNNKRGYSSSHVDRSADDFAFIAFDLKFGIVGINRGRKTIDAEMAKFVVFSRIYGIAKHWMITTQNKIGQNLATLTSVECLKKS